MKHKLNCGTKYTILIFTASDTHSYQWTEDVEKIILTRLIDFPLYSVTLLTECI
jgi:hypothetical protein